MCGRFALDVDPQEIWEAFEKRGVTTTDDSNPSVPDFDRNFNVGPTQMAPVYHDSRIELMKWGLIPFWTKDLKKATPWRTFNARRETLNESRLWKHTLKSHRCVVPVTGYYEWMTVKGQKTPFFIRRKDGELTFLAGMFDVVKREKEGQQDMISFTIVTGDAPEELKWLHERMPVVLEPGSEDWKNWLNRDKQQWSDEDIEKVLKTTCDTNILEWYQVSPDVGKIQNNGKRLMEPLRKKNGLDSFFKKRKADITVDENIKNEEGNEHVKVEMENEPPSKRVKVEKN